MAGNQDQASRKLVYLKDHTPRRRSRAARADRRSALPPEGLESEALWLGRVLLAVAALTGFHWLAVTSGAWHIADEASWRWTMSHNLAHAFLASSTALAGRLLLRRAPRATIFVAAAASCLFTLSLTGLSHLIVGPELDGISLGVRSDILIQGGGIGVAIWAGSYTLRADRRGD